MLAKCQLLLRFGCILMNNKDLPLRNCILIKYIYKLLFINVKPSIEEKCKVLYKVLLCIKAWEVHL